MKSVFVLTKNNVIRKVLILVFLFYVIGLIWLLFITVGSTERSTYFNKREIHLIPFKNTYTSFKSLNNIAATVPADQVPHYQYLFIRNIIGNILLLVPWGYMLPLLIQKRNSFKVVVISAIVFCFFIEGTQYVLTIGVFDIDDVIYNTSGAIIGFYLSRFIKSKSRNLIAS